MSRMTRFRAFLCFAVLALPLTFLQAGCGGSNQNEAENAQTAAPSVPPENPNESFAERRSRTRLVGKQAQKIESRNQKAAEKKESK